LRFLSICVVPIFVLAACITAPAMAQVDSVVSRRPPGKHRETTLLPSGDTIRYTLYVPGGTQGRGSGLPLVVAAHFGGEVTPWLGGAFADLLIVPAFSEIPAVIVAPDARSRRGWASTDEEGVLWLARQLLEVYSIDPRKVLVTGFSAGGAQTWRWANRNQDFFTAAIPISARPMSTGRPWLIPVYVIHSEDDELIPVGSVESYVQAQQADGAPLQLHVLYGISHFQTNGFVPALRDAVFWLREVWR